MTFPASPADLALHTEGQSNYQYIAAALAWISVDESAGAANLSSTASPTGVVVNSSTGTDATLPLATTTNSGLLAPADKTKLDATTGSNTGDQTSTTVPSTASGNLASTNVQDALVELQGDIDNLTSLNAANLISGTGVPAAGLGEDGEYHYQLDTGDYRGPKTGGAWGAIVANDRQQVGLADSTAVAIAGGTAGVAVTAARSDHAHIEPVGATLPATDGTGGRTFISDGSGAVPAGMYALPVTGAAWVQV